LKRAIGSKNALYGHDKEEAVYFQLDIDDKGNKLIG
jgi:hypothetical protein